MSYDGNSSVKVSQIKKLSEKVRTLLNVLSSRYDANVKASTDSDADYAAEMVDARTDAWSNVCSCLGESIRYGQTRAADNQTLIQEQLDEIASAIIEVTTMLAVILERIRSIEK